MTDPLARSRNYFQLFNISHKNDLTKLFRGIKRFQLDEKREEEGDNSKGLEDDFLSDDDDVPVSELPLDPVSEPSAPCLKEVVTVTCTTCNESFTDLSEQRLHYRLDWHRYNLKRKFYGQPPVMETEFGEMMDDLSSIEGSDDEDGEVLDLPIARLLEKVELDTEADVKQSKCKLKLQNSPNVFFENCDGEIFSLFKAIITKEIQKATTIEKDPESIMLSSFISNPPRWAILMVSGGHFAGAVFEGCTVVLHKTFHSYTVRAKQGGSQGSQDSKSGTSHPKSAGASLRRYNEASFNQHIQDLLLSWSDKLKLCSLILYRAASSSANSLFGGKNPQLQRNDPRIRNVPFPSKRPTFKEVKRVHSILSAVHIYGSREEFIVKHLTPKNKQDSAKSKRSKRKKPNIDRAKSRSPVKRDEPERPLSSPELGSDVEFTIEEFNEEINFSHLEEFGSSLTSRDIENRTKGNKNKKPKSKKEKTDEFPKPIGIVGDMAMCLSTNNGVEQFAELQCKLKNEIENRKSDSSFLDELNQFVNFQSLTILHLATAKELLDFIWLLLDCGCDPAIKDKSGKYPYNYAETKESKMIFRKFRGLYPDKYDYDKAQVPVPLSEEQEQEKQEKKRALNKLKREKEKQKKLEKREKEKETEEKDRFLNLSDREKRALAAERRILGGCKSSGAKAPILIRCFECATDITGRVPFEYNQNVFCSSKCLVIHRKKFPSALTA